MNEMEKIRDILLEHKGKRNAITSKSISAIMGYPKEDTQSVSRSKIEECQEIFGLPLVSCSRGYYIAETDEEMYEYNENIDKRITGMNQRRNMTNKFYKEGNKWNLL